MDHDPHALIGRLAVPDYGEITVYRSPKDDVLVVEIETLEATTAAGTATGANDVPRLRVYVNDGAVWEHPPYPSYPSATTVVGNDLRIIRKYNDDEEN
jgi:hypothetical protein